ncbi:MAG: tetratricopeptide repeat protein [Pirellulales bacterium]|nr:tetratricopeptide repeat protein [Pirellulales bacterium]
MSSSVATTALLPRRQAWIVSAWWDLTYVVVTPLLIVPVVLVLARRWLTPEEVSLAVIAFASLGHHLPGFMRAYGDRDLFLRYRARFLLVPPLVFALALLFSPPQSLRDSFHLPWTHLHGLELILLLWGTWHGLMQIYGFMRIYDVRMGVNDRWSARLDHWLCLVVFVAGMVFSDARVFAVANSVRQSGLPLFGPEWVDRARWLVGGLGVCVLVGYIVNYLIRYRRGEPTSWLKLLLIGMTGWFYWYTGKLSTNVLIGLAMFEIYHAVQYYAIVWIYNRRLFQRAGNKFGLLGFLFRDRWSMLGVYLAVIAAYSSIRFFTVDAGEYVFRGGSHDSYQWLVAFFVTSSMLHFYFDGFIWQVSEQKTQQNLVEECSSQARPERVVPGYVHSAKLACLFALALGLLFAEKFGVSHHPREESERIKAVAALTPDLPECQAMLCRNALQEGDAAAAIEHGQRALTLRPRSHGSRADLGLALMLAQRWEEARQRFEEAIAMEPANWSYHADLAEVWQRLGETEKAEYEIRRAVELRPDLAAPHQMLADFLLKQKRFDEAEAQYNKIAQKFPKSLAGEIYQILILARQGNYQQATELGYFLSISHPENWRVWLMLGTVLNISGDSEAAIEPLEKALRLGAPATKTNYQLGYAYLRAGNPAKAVRLLMKVVRREPKHFEARRHLANSFFAIKKYRMAIKHYEQCYQLNPHHAELCANLGAIYALLGKLDEAEKVYRGGLAANPDSGQLNFNLGILLHQLGQLEEANALIKRAQELGISVSKEVERVLQP